MTDLLGRKTDAIPTAKAPLVFSKVTTDHLQQDAVLYVRQSTSRQLRDH
jgi:hypothetical protein